MIKSKPKLGNPKFKSIPQLKTQLDKEFSIYIRNRDKKCFTCDAELEFKKLQAGHFVSRKHTATRFDEDNTHAQCISCNIFKKGNYPEYSARLIKKYGDGIIEDLVIRGKQPFKLTREFLNEQISYYKKANHEIEA